LIVLDRFNPLPRGILSLCALTDRYVEIPRFLGDSRLFRIRVLADSCSLFGFLCFAELLILQVLVALHPESPLRRGHPPDPAAPASKLPFLFQFNNQLPLTCSNPFGAVLVLRASGLDCQALPTRVSVAPGSRGLGPILGRPFLEEIFGVTYIDPGLGTGLEEHFRGSSLWQVGLQSFLSFGPSLVPTAYLPHSPLPHSSASTQSAYDSLSWCDTRSFCRPGVTNHGRRRPSTSFLSLPPNLTFFPPLPFPPLQFWL